MTEALIFLVYLEHSAAHRLLALDLLEFTILIDIVNIQDNKNRDYDYPRHSLFPPSIQATVNILPENFVHSS
jgi:hypothetical protein